MTLLDLSLVTRALINTIKVFVSGSEVWTGTGGDDWHLVPVVPYPPDQAEDGSLSIYPYHISEDPHFKNQTVPGAQVAPVRFTPMGLNLSYQLSVKVADGNEPEQYRAQLFMGLALKALHDHPILNDDTQINGIRIFRDTDLEDLADNDDRIRLSLQPIGHNEATGFWAAGSSALRLSAYYQASVILLEPEDLPTRATRVLRYGVQTFVNGMPRLDGSENTVSFTLPESGERQEIRLRPAEVPPGAGPASRVAFTGVDLAGDQTYLMLRSANWTEPLQADDAWDVDVSPTRVVATVGGTLGSQILLPGIYAASVQVTRRRSLPDGSIRDFVQPSNETPFAVTPRIDDPVEVTADGLVTLEGHIFYHDDIDPEEDIQVYLAADRLHWQRSGPPGSMAYTVTEENTLQFRLPGGLTPGTHLPLRILINGAASAPRWIEVPPP